MSVSLECKKIKRTGFLPAFFGGGILAAAVPVTNMTVRSEQHLNLPGGPMQILLNANWQMMAMLNVLLVVSGTCLLYHTEYVDNAMQKMKSLPIRESSVFFGKAVLTLPTKNFALSLFPFAMPFQVFADTDIAQSMHYIYASTAECAVLVLTELIFIKVRRFFE